MVRVAPINLGFGWPYKLASAEEVASNGICGAACLVAKPSFVEHFDHVRCVQVPLTSLDGLSTSLQLLPLQHCQELRHLSGMGELRALQRLQISSCGLTSLQPLTLLPVGFGKLSVRDCPEVVEVVLQLPQIQRTADVVVLYSNVKEVVLAGGVQKTVKSVRKCKSFW